MVRAQLDSSHAPASPSARRHFSLTPRRPPVIALLATCLGFAVASAQQPPLPLSSEAHARSFDAAPGGAIPAWQPDFMVKAAGDSASEDGTGSRDATGADGTWLQLPPPSARYLHVAVFDPLRNRMVVFGGASTRGLVNDVWVLSLAGPPEWSQLNPTGVAPSPRHFMSAIYDPLRDRIVVFGGVDATGVRDDVWALSLDATPTWTHLAPTGAGPGALTRHSAIYDPVGRRMIVFGGYHAGVSSADSGPSSETWALSLSDRPAWTQVSPAGPKPSPRYDQRAVYDPFRDRVVVFGGFDGRTSLNDVWALSLRGRPHWRGLNPTGQLPAPRFEHAAIFDPAGDRMVVFSGIEDGGVSDTWALSLGGRNVWTRIVAPSEPSVRSGHTAIYDPVRARMVVYGGTLDGFRLSGEIWALSLSSAPTWANLTTPDSPPESRWGHSAIYDPVRARMLVFGGYDGGWLNDVWALSLSGRPVWTMLHPSGTPPSPREGQTAIYDPVRDRMLVFGGEVGLPIMSNEVWALSLSGDPAWVKLAPGGETPAPRTSHTAIYDAAHDRMVVFGGVSPSAYLADIWSLSLSPEPSWTRLTPTGTPPCARFEHSAVYDPVRQRMVVFGGLTSGLNSLHDLWALSLAAAPAWTQLTPTGTTPPGTSDHRAIFDPRRDRMIVSGGFSYDGGSDPSVETWALSLGQPEWTLLHPVGGSSGSRLAHSAVYDPLGDRMLVFGGDGVSNDVWELRWGPRASLPRTFVDEVRREAVPSLVPPRVAPNPSRGDVSISFSLPQEGEVSVRVFDVAGRDVRTLASGILPAGRRTIVWDRRTSAGVLATPGLYLCEVRANGHTSVLRVVLIR